MVGFSAIHAQIITSGLLRGGETSQQFFQIRKKSGKFSVLGSVRRIDILAATRFSHVIRNRYSVFT